MAPAVSSALSQCDYNGKTVVPFQTNGGWPGNVIEDIKDDCAGATFGPAIEVQFDSTGGSDQVTPQRTVDVWVEKVRDLL